MMNLKSNLYNKHLIPQIFLDYFYDYIDDKSNQQFYKICEDFINKLIVDISNQKVVVQNINKLLEIKRKEVNEVLKEKKVLEKLKIIFKYLQQPNNSENNQMILLDEEEEEEGCTLTSSDCTNLQSFDSENCECVTDKKKCDDGSIVALDETCPDVCVQTSCNSGYEWDEDSCSCQPINCCIRVATANGFYECRNNIVMKFSVFVVIGKILLKFCTASASPWRNATLVLTVSFCTTDGKQNAIIV